MQVHLIHKGTIEAYAAKNTQSRAGFSIWLGLIKHADWENANDILETYRSADILGNGSDRVVFDIGGNKYRMICAYAFGDTRVRLFVKWIGTHADYDKLCNKEEQYTVNEF